MKATRALTLLSCLPLLVSCWIDVQVPPGGAVVTESGRFRCDAGQTCPIEVSDEDFAEVFIAEPDEGQVFDGWQGGQDYLCGGSTTACALSTEGFESNPALLGLLASDRRFPLVPLFRAARNYSLAGEIGATANAFVDGDINDPNAEYIPNDLTDTAQPVPNPVSIGGYVSVAGEGPPGPSRDFGDRDDYYAIDLLAGQIVTLAVAEPLAGDIDLYLYDERGRIIDFSLETGIFERIRIPADGRYFLNAFAFSGASNYSMTVGRESAANAPARLEFRVGEAIVRYRDQDVPARAAAAQARAQLTTFALDQSLLRTLADKGQFSEPERFQQWLTLMRIKSMRSDPAVEYAEPNYTYRHYAITPDDEYYPLQHHYGQIRLPEAWEQTTGDPGVIVAVIDTGVLLDHPDLAGQLGSGFDFISDPDNAADGDGIDPNADDTGDGGFGRSSSFHGTHVAGTVAAASDNGVGVSGVAWDSTIMPLRVLGTQGGSTYDIIQALRYAAGLPNDSGTLPERPASVVNMSLGGPGRSLAMRDTIRQVRTRGVTVVAAAGNEGSSAPSYPAAYDGVISVGAVGPGNRLTDYSNFGSRIDLVAPGGDMRRDSDGDGYPDGVLSTAADDSDGDLQFTLAFKQGTSMAAPHVAGVIALMLAVNPELTPAAIDRLIAGGRLSVDLGTPGRDDLFGHGVIDARLAVLAALDADEPPPAEATQLTALPPELSLGTGEASLTLGRAGDADLQVTSISADDDWLVITRQEVDDDGLGRYSVRARATTLEPGIHETSIRVSSTAGSTIIPVLAYVAAEGFTPSTGLVYALLLDEDGALVEQQVLAPEAGRYRYRFEGIREGSYTVVVGSDMDNDQFICDQGEACGAWPTVAYPQPVILDADKLNANFPIGFDASLQSGAQSQGAGARGLPRRATQPPDREAPRRASPQR